MFIADCYAHFIQLAKFAQQCEVPDEAARAYKFQRGMKLEYKPFMASQSELQ